MRALWPQAVLNLDEVLRDVLAWDMYAVLASEASGGWGRAAQQAPLGFPGIEAYVEASWSILLPYLRTSCWSHAMQGACWRHTHI
jgi:hypothetical protein